LLRYTAVLGDPAVRRAMQGVKSPKWFSKVGWELLDVPEQLRPFAPNWVCAGGFSDRERTAFLTRWARATGTKLGQAAARALGKLGQTDAQRETRGGVRGRPDTFTWSHTGDAIHAQPNSAPPPPKRDPTSDSSRNAEFVMLWQLCRRTPPGENGELVALLLEHIGVWGHRLADCARSPDPRDRILAMQIIRTGGLSKAFRFELEALEHDKIEGIRKLAAAMLDTSVTPDADHQVAQPSPPKPVAPTVEPTQEARDTLKTIMTELINRDDIRAEESVMLMDELKIRLRQLYGRKRSESSDESTAGQVSV
ncbi:MAG: hypothetical protein IID33_17500, partial [Planctomycetes bacterium]|nr:hypothetical protein [Planctomycetota bacterium]